MYQVLETNGKFSILEQNTQLTILETEDNMYVEDVMSNLLAGSGFCGWTPNFFTMAYGESKNDYDDCA